MFYEGLQGAGPNFTRQKVIDALNKMTDQTLGRADPAAELDQRTTTSPTDSRARRCVKIEDGKFVPTFNEPGKPFMCLPDQPAKLPTTATYQ